MRGGLAFTSVLVALWLALFGLAALILRYGVVEVLCVELAGVVFAVIGGALLVVDTRATDCAHEPDCGDVR